MMKKKTFRFSSGSTDFYFAGGFRQLSQLCDPRSTVLVTDENVFNAHQSRFKRWKTIVLKAGERYKIQATVDDIIRQLIELEADRKTTLVGVGGGVITDITGYAASIYMRGIRFGFVPTSLLALVDASIGGKNGIDIGIYKNMAGVIRQPAFILHDMIFLKTLPEAEWENGFAEIIKHACIRDAVMFRELEERSLHHYRRRQTAICELVQRNALIKAKIVQQDEFEKSERRLLNFGHTLAHALENQYEMMHGHAVSIGMHCACHISEQLTGFKQTDRVVKLLEKYGLPTYLEFDRKKAFGILKMDKKRERKDMNYVLLDKIGRAHIQSLPLVTLEKFISNF